MRSTQNTSAGRSDSPRPLLRVLWESLAAISLTLLIGYLDYHTGIELRVFPLYFVPVGLVAWRAGRIPGFLLSLVAISVWELSNLLAGMHYRTPFIAYWNATVQWGSLVAFAILLGRLRSLMDQARALSRVDALTGLSNSRAFFELLASETARARRYQYPLTVVYIDLDNFKLVNDSRGHQAGDEVLVLTARLLRSGCRASDSVARLGGDEFALLLPETQLEDARTLLTRLQQSIRSQMKERALPVTASVGAVTFEAIPTQTEDLVKRADALMYQVKSSGKDAFRIERSTT